MKCMMKEIAMGLLAMAAILAVQMGLTGVLGFRIAEQIGKTAVTALFLYAVIRVAQSFRAERGADGSQK